MSLNLPRIYYNALAGMIGGLLAWAIIGLLPVNTTTLISLFIKDVAQGAVIGVLMGGLLGAVDGTFFNRSARHLFRGAVVGALVGAIGGVIGLVLGEIIFSLAGGGLVPRALGWGVFGALVGTAEGIANRRRDKLRYGMLGGALGGLIGGAAYERLSLLLRGFGFDRDAALTVGGALGLIILGACIGALIGLVEDMLRRASLKILWGPREGEIISLTSAKPQMLGRAETCDVYLRGDSDMQLRHALISANGQSFSIRSQDGPVQILREGGWQPVPEVTLVSGDEFKLGRTRMRFNKED